MNPWALEIQQVSKQFPDGTYALQNIEWSMTEGETMALIGESGSGKTTFLRLLNRLIEPTTGAVVIQGKPACLQDPIQLRRRLGYVPQDGGLFPHWTIKQNVCLVPHLLGWPLEQQLERLDRLLSLVNLNPSQIAERYPIELSGGQRQRVAVARALAAFQHPVARAEVEALPPRVRRVALPLQELAHGQGAGVRRTETGEHDDRVAIPRRHRAQPGRDGEQRRELPGRAGFEHQQPRAGRGDVGRRRWGRCRGRRFRLGARARDARHTPPC